MYKLLSYRLTDKTLGYGGKKYIAVEPSRQLSKGDSCNTTIVRIHMHCGTHIDTPYHFFRRGKSLSDYSINDLIFKKPLVVDCPKDKGDLVTKDGLATLRGKLKRCDILLLRTGFSKLRNRNVYYTNNPGISPELAILIRKEYQNIKCVGVDSISVSPYKNRELGRKTHEIFLKGKGVLLLEDMDLRDRLTNLKRIRQIIVSPLYISKLEAAPCTVIGCM